MNKVWYLVFGILQSLHFKDSKNEWNLINQSHQRDKVQLTITNFCSCYFNYFFKSSWDCFSREKRKYLSFQRFSFKFSTRHYWLPKLQQLLSHPPRRNLWTKPFEDNSIGLQTFPLVGFAWVAKLTRNGRKTFSSAAWWTCVAASGSVVLGIACSFCVVLSNCLPNFCSLSLKLLPGFIGFFTINISWSNLMVQRWY